MTTQDKHRLMLLDIDTGEHVATIFFAGVAHWYTRKGAGSASSREEALRQIQASLDMTGDKTKEKGPR